MCRRFGTLCQFHLHRWCCVVLTTCQDRTDVVFPKRRKIKFRRQGITQKKEQHSESGEVLNKEGICFIYFIHISLISHFARLTF